ncbi:MAG: response regulator, partial [Burkholderiales bacterium]|nr:response regulator [Burkholderiales bacterium]
RETPLPAVTEGATTRTLLYIEDNAANMKLVEQIIARRPDLRLLKATESATGIAAAIANQPEVILMDINMPGMSGIEAMKILRLDPSTAHIPIIALSANAMPNDIAKGLEAGFFNYITKPMKVNEFMDALDAALIFSKLTAGSTAKKA